MIDEAGAFNGPPPPFPGSGELRLFRVRMRATQRGPLEFVPDPAENPGHNYLLYGVNDALAFDDVSFEGAALNIVPEPATATLAACGLAAFAVIGARRGRNRGVNADRFSLSVKNWTCPSFFPKTKG